MIRRVMPSFRLLVDRLGASRALPFLLYFLVAAGSVLRVWEAFLHNPLDQLFSDPARHWEYAHQTLSWSPWAVIDPPLFQMWVSLVQKWSFGVPLLVAVYTGLLSVATPWLWYGFLRQYLRLRMLALVGWAAFALLPSWIAIFSYFMTETLFLPLLGASLWQTMRADRKLTVASFSGMVALWTLTGLTRGIAVPLGGLAGLWVWLRHPRKVRTAGASILVVVSMLAPIAIRNHHFLNLWSPLGTGWPNQIYAASGKQVIELALTSEGTVWNYEFGSPSLYAKQLAPLSDWEPKRTGRVKVSVDLVKGPVDWQSVYQNNVLHGWAGLRLRWENLVLVMLGESWPDSNFEWPVPRAAHNMRWIWAPLFLFVMGAAAFRYRTVLARPLLPMLIAAWFFFQALSLLAVNEGRYRKPLEGLLMVEVLVILDRRLSPSSALRA
jgi:hypothetical protein